jgi:hypothetical protein
VLVEMQDEIEQPREELHLHSSRKAASGWAGRDGRGFR